MLPTNLPILNMGTNAHTKILCTQAPIKSQKLPADKHIGRQGQKRRLHTMCHRRRRSHHVSQKTTVHTTCHKDDGYTPMSRRTVATNRMLPRTVVTNHMSLNAAENHMSTTVVKPYVKKTRLNPYVKDGGYKPYVKHM